MRRSKKPSAAHTTGRVRRNAYAAATRSQAGRRPASTTDLTDLNALDAEEVGSWTARHNISAQEAFLTHLVAAVGEDRSHVASQLGITVDELDEVLSGRVDLNLSEIRLLGVAAELVVTFEVAPARPEFVRWLTSARNWARDVSVKSAHQDVSAPDPAQYGRRALKTG